MGRPVMDEAQGQVVVIPEPALVVLVGASGSGKSSFAARHFRPTEVLSSDRYRAIITDDEADQSASTAAFATLYFLARLRLGYRRLTVIDATSVSPGERASLLEIARPHSVPAIAIVLDLDAEHCLAHDAVRPGRHVGPAVVLRQIATLRQGLPGLASEGFHAIHLLRTPAEVAALRLARATQQPASLPDGDADGGEQHGGGGG